MSLYHNHTRESLTVTFRRNGQYDPRALEQLNWFLRDWRLDEPTEMDPRLFDTIWAVDREVGSDEAIHVNSAYRSPSTNAMLRRRSRAVAKNSQHMRGKAMDFYLPDVPIERVRAVGMRLQDGGVGYYPSAYTPFVHLDVGSVRAWPRMTRDQLARIFPDGKTVHIPADGEPMARYEEARAEVLAKRGAVGRLHDRRRGRGRGRSAAHPQLLGDPLRHRRRGRGRGGDQHARERQVYVARRAPPPAVTGNREFGLRGSRAGARGAAPGAGPRPPGPAADARPEPAAPAVAAALREPLDAPKPALPPTRFAGLPATVATPAGPRLAWQPGPAPASPPAPAPDREPAPLPPRRPGDSVVTGALAFVPMPPSRPGPDALAFRMPSEDAAAAPPASAPLPPPRPGQRPPAIAVAAAEPLPIPSDRSAEERAGAERTQLRRLLAAAAAPDHGTGTDHPRERRKAPGPRAGRDRPVRRGADAECRRIFAASDGQPRRQPLQRRRGESPGARALVKAGRGAQAIMPSACR